MASNWTALATEQVKTWWVSQGGVWPEPIGHDLNGLIGAVAGVATDAYAEGRRDLLLELNADGCPHGCSFPCPFHRRLAEIGTTP